MRERRFPTIGRCIYCGSTEDLSDEHIIPLSLRGEHVFEKASCRRCRDLTSRDELDCARGIFQATRIAHDFPTRRKKERPKTTKIVVESAGARQELHVPVEMAPTAPLPVPLLPMAGLLVGREPSIEVPGIQYALVFALPHNHDARLRALKKKGPTKVELEVKWNLNPFLCLLAKVAHGFAVAGHGPDAFTPLLPDYILDRDRRLSHVIGGCDAHIAVPGDPPNTPTHAWQVGIREVGAKKYVAVLVQLFRYLGFPVYEVIAGEASGALLKTLAERDSGRGPSA